MREPIHVTDLGNRRQRKQVLDALFIRGLTAQFNNPPTCGINYKG